MDNLKEKYLKIYGSECTHTFEVFGRAELAGNHTDHQHGQVIAATVEPAIYAAAELNGTDTINIYSEGREPYSVKLDKLYPITREKGESAALVRGMASRYPKVKGFNAYIKSEVPVGSGLSSSAAFEVLIGKIIETLCNCKTDPTTLAMNAQYAENVFFGKPCGLMDQIACAYGGIVHIDFRQSIPTVTRLNYDFEENGYTLCIIKSGTDHADLTDCYAEIPNELRTISNYFYQDDLSHVSQSQFRQQLPELRKYAGDRAVLRAMHVINENYRVEEMKDNLINNDIDNYLHRVNDSGESSWMLLQNVIQCGETKNQGLAFAISTAKLFLSGKGACRVMGGGFAGCFQAYVPNDMLPRFKVGVDRVLGKNSVMPTKITYYEDQDK